MWQRGESTVPNVQCYYFYFSNFVRQLTSVSREMGMPFEGQPCFSKYASTPADSNGSSQHGNGLSRNGIGRQVPKYYNHLLMFSKIGAVAKYETVLQPANFTTVPKFPTEKNHIVNAKEETGK